MNKFIILAALIACSTSSFSESYNRGDEANALITNYESDITPDGSHHLTVETSNGIRIHEQGVGGVVASGQITYVSPDGTPIQLLYTADEFGFHPEGDHLPQPHPIPDAILRSIEWNAAHANAVPEKRAKQ